MISAGTAALAMVLETVVTLNAQSHVEPITRLGMIASEVTTYDAARADHGDSGAVHACLGWANANYFLGIPTATDQLLLRVGSDSGSRFQWGDAASIFFCIPSVALAKQDFTKTYCLMDK